MKNLLKLTLLLLATLLPATATAYDFEVDGIYYMFVGNTAFVTHGDNPYHGNVVIPASVFYNGKSYTVTGIDQATFKECYDLKNVVIGNSVMTIGNEAFAYCGELKSVNIPKYVNYIGDEAFNECSSLTSIDIPNSVTYLGNLAFFCCYSLANLTIGNSVTTIGAMAFAGCSSLTSLDIPNSVTSIYWSAFAGCSNLSSITIGKSLSYFPTDAFSGCKNLTSITVASDNQTYDSRNNCNAIIETASNTLAFGCKNTIIPNTVSSIGWSAFSGCTGLTSINIPNSVSRIGMEAFSSCRGLTSIGIPYCVDMIDSYAFEGCDNLNEVYSHICDPSMISMGDEVFNRSPNNYDERTLYVPTGSLAAYQADNKWSDYFGSIVEMEFEPTAITESIQLNVTTAGLNEGATLQLTAMVQPEEGTSKKMNWASSNPSVATVDDNGLVTTHSVGTVTITAMTTDGSNLSASCTVTLLPVGLKGDVNDDGRVNISDVSDLIDILLKGY